MCVDLFLKLHFSELNLERERSLNLCPHLCNTGFNEITSKSSSSFPSLKNFSVSAKFLKVLKKEENKQTQRLEKVILRKFFSVRHMSSRIGESRGKI